MHIAWWHLGISNCNPLARLASYFNPLFRLTCNEMPLRIQTRLGSVLRLRRRRRHGSCGLDSTEVACKHQADETSTQASKDVAPVAEQEGSRFLQKLPIEIRRMSKLFPHCTLLPPTLI